MTSGRNGGFGNGVKMAAIAGAATGHPIGIVSGGWSTWDNPPEQVAVDLAAGAKMPEKAAAAESLWMLVTAYLGDASLFGGPNGYIGGSMR